MKGMMSIMSIVATMTPMEVHIEKLEEKIADYKSAVTEKEKEEAEKRLLPVVTLISLKLMNGDKTPEEALEESEKVEQAAETVRKMVDPKIQDQN